MWYTTTQIELAADCYSLLCPCPNCQTENTSTKFGSTCLPVGRMANGHIHDTNCRTFHFDCKNCEQKYKHRPLLICPVKDCDWKGTAKCFCSPPQYTTQEMIDQGYIPHYENGKITSWSFWGGSLFT